MSNKIGTLKYNLEDADAKREMQAALQVNSLIVALQTLDTEVFRPKIKYGYEEYTEAELNLLEKLREEVGRHINEYVPNLEEL